MAIQNGRRGQFLFLKMMCTEKKNSPKIEDLFTRKHQEQHKCVIIRKFEDSIDINHDTRSNMAVQDGCWWQFSLKMIFFAYKMVFHQNN